MVQVALTGTMNRTYYPLDSHILFVVVLCLYLESVPSLQENAYNAMSYRV